MNQIIPGSLSSLATQSKKSIAETFIGADVIVIVDVSGSMADCDSRGGLSRYEVACQELAKLQNSLPGKIAVIGFSSDTEFCPGGLPYFQQGGTDMAKALKFVKIADLPGMRFILISDGKPDDENETLKIAKSFQAHIDVIYVGPESMPFGRDFLNRLAAATGGKSVTADRAKELAASVTQLLGSGSV
jgi:Mg-chelatase subunit ChlD